MATTRIGTSTAPAVITEARHLSKVESRSILSKWLRDQDCEQKHDEGTVFLPDTPPCPRSNRPWSRTPISGKRPESKKPLITSNSPPSTSGTAPAAPRPPPGSHPFRPSTKDCIVPAYDVERKRPPCNLRFEIASCENDTIAARLRGSWFAGFSKDFRGWLCLGVWHVFC